MKKKLVLVFLSLIMVLSLIGCKEKEPENVSDKLMGLYWGQSRVGVEAALGDSIISNDLLEDGSVVIVGKFDAADMGFPIRDDVECSAIYIINNDRLQSISISYVGENKDDLLAIGSACLINLDTEYGNSKSHIESGDYETYQWNDKVSDVQLEIHPVFGVTISYKPYIK